MTVATTNEPRHVPELQSLRGVAACLVVVGHCVSCYLSPDWYTTIKRLVNTQAAVEIFFVLSGFVLALSLKRRGFGKTAIGAYYIRRLFRIYPALIVASTLAFVYVALVHYRIPGTHDSVWMSERFPHDRFTPLHIAASFAGMLAFLIPPVWTIFIELFNSVVLPPIVWLSQKIGSVFGLVVFALAALGLVTGGALYYHLDLYFFNFALGVAIAMPLPRLILFCRHLPMTFIVYVAAALLLVTRALMRVDAFNPWMNLYDTLLAATIIFSLGRLGVAIPALKGRTIEWIGDISFSIYLLHFPIMMIINRALYALAPRLVEIIGPIAAGWLLAAITLPATILLSGLNFRFVEMAGIKLGERALRMLGMTPIRERARSAP